ncbi:uncharacterized protein LOC130646269 isoform X1 [Hydractinia symbiolongicarpus]|uniref:uncharacterized protein LOC130646269 isoform X1 n=1 Tax=Hydractinia symbiolongicarpus TaxID=13093 RepID=UPI00255164C0|nr:uncharacterized protein LOC130646269 isoform X1 [Hydractinia symbiolongicarpus]
MTTIASATTLSFATLAFGFSSHFNWALIARLLQGCFMGINVVIKAFMADICDDTNQGFGMTLLMCSYSTGLILGPSIGAFLAFPALQYPKLFSKESFFGRFAILLPHIFVVVCFIVVIPMAVYILPDDKSKQNKTARKQSVDLTEKIKEISQDNGCDLKDADEHYYTTSFTENEQILNRKSKKKQYLSINTLEHSTEENNCYNGTLLRESKLVKCIQKPCLLSCLLYGSYAIIAIGYDELFPIFAATSKKYGGFAFTTSNIGVSLLVVAAVSVVLEIPLATKLIAKYGAKRVFIACTMLQSFLFPMHVVLTQISNTTLFWFLLIFTLIVTRLCIEGSLITVAVFLNNSVEAELLGTANGIGMTVSAVGRMIAPSLFGTLFSWSLKNVTNIEENKHPFGFPFNQYFVFYLMSFIGILNAVFVGSFPDSINYKKKL